MKRVSTHNASARWRLPSRFFTLLAVMLGIPAGLGLFTFVQAEGISYLLNDPKVCVNCHVMREAYDNWQHSSHTAVAICHDCHAPRDFIGKWGTKAINGWNHGSAFTTGNFPDPIRIKPMNVRIVQGNCVYCHESLVSQIHRSGGGQERKCIDCHGNVGHGW